MIDGVLQSASTTTSIYTHTEQITETFHAANNALMVALGNIGLAKMYIDENREKSIEQLEKAGESIMLMKGLLAQIQSLTETIAAQNRALDQE